MITLLCDDQAEFENIIFNNSKNIVYFEKTSQSLNDIRACYSNLSIYTNSQVMRCNPVFKYHDNGTQIYLQDLKYINLDHLQKLSYLYTCDVRKFNILKLKYEYDFYLNNLKLSKLPDTIEFLTKNYTKNIDFHSSDVQFFRFANPIIKFVDHFYLGYLVFYPFYVDPII